MWKAVTTPFMNIEKINPLHQEAVRKMVDLCKEDPNIKKAVVFGSSVRDDCRPDSDIDIYFEFVGEKTKWPALGEMIVWDKWDNYTVDRRMAYEIGRTGVVVYERAE
ncbi:nucleotidyltransferase family protein [Anaerovibrio sp. RM50]|uniref:nucleotidyltransferase family protein n=1 Tax=Anaerovibrio sp. RM50 TaxID=1200557 RepID=UPI00056C2EF6|nr:nucleotidyltransferase domain-containing protein [Anaerovibrio sp. RM50]